MEGMRRRVRFRGGRVGGELRNSKVKLMWWWVVVWEDCSDSLNYDSIAFGVV